MTISIMEIIKTMIRRMAFNAMTLRIMTINIAQFNTMTLSMATLCMVPSWNDTQHIPKMTFSITTVNMVTFRKMIV
jgi:hypothetical protein